MMGVAILVVSNLGLGSVGLGSLGLEEDRDTAIKALEAGEFEEAARLATAGCLSEKGERVLWDVLAKLPEKIGGYEIGVEPRSKQDVRFYRRGLAIMVRIPGGAVSFGSRAETAMPEESPPMAVRLGSYWMGLFEVTRRAYQEFLVETSYAPPPTWSSLVRELDCPMVDVSWEDAKAFCEYAKGRLPREVEWEWAARPRDGGEYPWGKDPGPHANYNDTYLGRVKIVGSYPSGRSKFGLFDMAGNVSEWCLDDYDPYRLWKDRPEARLKAMKVVRGGSYWDPPNLCRVTYRGAYGPKGRGETLGFRLLRERGR